MRSFILFNCWASAAALSTSTNALKQAIDLVMIKHDAATARTSQPFQTWSADGAAPATIEVPVDVTPYAYPTGCADVPELFAAAPCCAVTAAPLFSADECAFIIDEAERKDGWVPQEFRYARDVVQQCEDLPEVRSWLEAACRESLFPLLQRTFPEVVGAGAAAPAPTTSGNVRCKRGNSDSRQAASSQLLTSGRSSHCWTTSRA